MKKTFLIFTLTLLSNILMAQQKNEAEKLVNDGIPYHDKGDYDGAISKYNKALELDKDNLLALTEKAFSLLLLKKYDESIQCCQLAIEKHSGEKELKTIYVTYGNATDELKRTDKSIEIYNEGIKLFPNSYQLYYNKGITLSSIKKYAEAILCFEKAISINPKHSSSHNAIGQLLNNKNERIPSLLATCRFLILEPESKRAKNNLIRLQEIMNGNVEKSDKKGGVTVYISEKMLGDTLANGKPAENSFSTTDMILRMTTALDFDKKNKNKTDVEQFIRKFETVCASLEEVQKNNFGFYWDFYVPYFIEMKNKQLINTFAYIAFASSENPEVTKWLKSHPDETTKFYDWSKSFVWKTND